MGKIRQTTSKILIATMLLSNSQSIVVHANNEVENFDKINTLEREAQNSTTQKEKYKITLIDKEKVKNEIKEKNIFYKGERIAPERPYINNISKSVISIGSYYNANIGLYGKARKGSTVYIKLGSQVNSQYIDDSQNFGFNIETKSRNITVELYTVNHRGEQSDSIYVNLTSDGDYISNNGSYPTPNTLPTISTKDSTIRLNSEFDPLKDVVASDNEDGDLTNQLIITENTVNTNKIGDYKVVYQVIDSDDNIAIKERNIRVDVNKEPVININEIILKVGDRFNPLEYVNAIDNEDGDITSKVEVIESTVNINKEGIYKVVYKVTDSEGASAIKETKVTVIEAVDVTPPELKGLSVDKKVVKPGDKVTISIDMIDNQSGIDWIEVEMGGENSNQLALSELSYNEESKKYEFTIEIDGTMPNGIYSIFYIGTQDKAGNYASFENPTDLSLADFKVVDSINGYQDLIKSVTIDKRKPQIGDTINISIELANNSYIGAIEIPYKNSDKDKLVKLEYNEVTNRYEGRLTIDKNTKIGSWSPEYIEFTSNSGKWITIIFIENYGLKDKFKFEVIKFGWINQNGKWYYLDDSGEMKTGWLNQKGKWYYLDDSGEMKTGWLNKKGKWYYLDDSGEMKTGWIKEKGKWY